MSKEKRFVFKYERMNGIETVTFLFNECVITITSTADNTGEPLELVRQILLSVFDTANGG